MSPCGFILNSQAGADNQLTTYRDRTNYQANNHKGGSRKVESNWLTHILDVTGGLSLVDRDLFCTLQTSSSACFYKQTTFFSRRGRRSVILKACQHCWILSLALKKKFTDKLQKLFKKNKKKNKKKSRVNEFLGRNRRLSVFVFVVRAVNAWSTIGTSNLSTLYLRSSARLTFSQ